MKGPEKCRWESHSPGLSFSLLLLLRWIPFRNTFLHLPISLAILTATTPFSSLNLPNCSVSPCASFIWCSWSYLNLVQLMMIRLSSKECSRRYEALCARVIPGIGGFTTLWTRDKARGGGGIGAHIVSCSSMETLSAYCADKSPLVAFAATYVTAFTSPLPLWGSWGISLSKVPPLFGAIICVRTPTLSPSSQQPIVSHECEQDNHQGHTHDSPSLTLDLEYNRTQWYDDDLLCKPLESV